MVSAHRRYSIGESLASHAQAGQIDIDHGDVGDENDLE